MSKNTRKALSIIGQLGLAVLIIWLLADRLLAGAAQAADVLVTFRWQLIAATALFTVAVPTTGLIWGRLLTDIEPKANIHSFEAARVHVLSWLLKYIPGQAGSLLTKVFWAKKAGVSQKHVVASIMYENVFLASSSVLLSIPFLGVTVVEQLGADNSLLLPLLLTAIVLPLLVPSVFSSILQVGLKLLRRKPIDKNDLLDGKQVFVSQLLFLIPRIINGLGFVLIATIFYDPSLIEVLQLSGAYVLAGILGVLAFFVPSGLGVREAVIAIAAAPILGVETAAACALIARVCATAADGVLGGTYLLSKGRHAN